MEGDLGPLSEREMEVLKLVATGATNQQIARALVISPNTVKVHLRNIYEKLQVQSRTEATMEAVRRGWVSVPGGTVTAETTAALALPLPIEATYPTLPIARWQRIYMVCAALLVVAALALPGWQRSRSETPRASALTDVGQPQVLPASRPQVPRWDVLAPLPEARSRLALVAAGGKLYAIGGETASGVTGEVTIYDPRSNGWLPGTRKPTPVSNIAGALLDDLIYVPGGTTATGGATNILEVYDPRTAAWEARASLPRPAAAYGLAVLGDKLYLFGGWDGTSYRAETYIYDPVSDSWSTGTSMAQPHAFLAACAFEDAIYVVGGYTGERELDTVSVYDPKGEGTTGGSWTARASLGQARGGLALTALGSRLYAIGGGWTMPLAYNEQYDALTGAWSRIDTPVAGEWRNLGLAASEQQIYAVGGWSGSYLPVNEQYQALLRQLLPLGTKGG